MIKYQYVFGYKGVFSYKLIKVVTNTQLTCVFASAASQSQDVEFLHNPNRSCYQYSLLFSPFLIPRCNGGIMFQVANIDSSSKPS